MEHRHGIAPAKMLAKRDGHILDNLLVFRQEGVTQGEAQYNPANEKAGQLPRFSRFGLEMKFVIPNAKRRNLICVHCYSVLGA